MMSLVVRMPVPGPHGAQRCKAAKKTVVLCNKKADLTYSVACKFLAIFRQLAKALLKIQDGTLVEKRLLYTIGCFYILCSYVSAV